MLQRQANFQRWNDSKLMIRYKNSQVRPTGRHEKCPGIDIMIMFEFTTAQLKLSPQKRTQQNS